MGEAAPCAQGNELWDEQHTQKLLTIECNNLKYQDITQGLYIKLIS